MFQKEIFAQRLREARNGANEKQADVAQLLGVKPNQIVEMENARKTTTFEKLCKLCEHYNVSADYLLGLIDDPKPLKMEKTEQKEGQL